MIAITRRVSFQYPHLFIYVVSKHDRFERKEPYGLPRIDKKMQQKRRSVAVSEIDEHDTPLQHIKAPGGLPNMQCHNKSITRKLSQQLATYNADLSSVLLCSHRRTCNIFINNCNSLIVSFLLRVPKETKTCSFSKAVWDINVPLLNCYTLCIRNQNKTRNTQYRVQTLLQAFNYVFFPHLDKGVFLMY